MQDPKPDAKKTEKPDNRNMKDPNYPFGRVLVSLEVYPEKLALNSKVGKGREEPNINPYLPPPVGRMSFSWNPYKLIVIILSYYFIF